MTGEPRPASELILYQTEDGRTRIQCRFEDETVWLTQKLMAELFQIGVGTVNHHLKAIFAEGELQPEATVRRYRIVRNEGRRQIAREVEHYRLEAILAVGFRVRSHRGMQFRSSDRRFYQKVLDIFATSVDYTPNAEMAQPFFATVQNKMHWGTHGQTAAEVTHARVDAHQPFMGLRTTRPKS